MDDGTRYTIGELARRTGLSVRTIRFYSDSGVIPPAGRSPAGYRLYDLGALHHLDLVRTLRSLGVDLATIQRILDREILIPDAAAAHAEALDVQIRTLQLRRAVLRAVAKRGSSPKEMQLMHKLAQLSDQERRRIIGDFIDEAFAGLDANPEFVAMMRSAMPELPDDPAPEQVDAWVELAELAQDPGFKAGIRRAAEYQAARRAQDAEVGSGLHRQLADMVREKVGAALAAGIGPDSGRAGPVADELVAAYAEAFGRTDSPAFRAWILERLQIASDPRAERYWQLLAVINGWPVPATLTPAFEWFTRALQQASTG